MKTLGKLSFQDGKWRIDAEPDVLLRCKRVFARMDKNQHGFVTLTDSVDTARDIEWFLERYPLEFEPPELVKRLKKGADKQREREAVVEAILMRKGEPRDFDLAEPARDYQRAAAELAIAGGGLLLCDEMGLGKAQPLGALVHTPAGWKRMGDLKVGDAVTDPDRGVAGVKRVLPQGERQRFPVSTVDGSSGRMLRPKPCGPSGREKTGPGKPG